MRAYERLLKYTQYPSASDENVATCPSTPEQMDFARDLAAELTALGVPQVELADNGYVYATIPANCDCNAPAIGFIAHMDVVRDVEYRDIQPRIIENYDGGTIVLNEALNITMSPDDYETLKSCTGKDLIVTDGTTLLGGDDKAGIAEIMTMAERLMSDASIKHGVVKIGFTPDEEIGRGADGFDVARFGADFAYTVDGGAAGQVEYETFNAAELTVTVNGYNIHPGTAKDKMINSIHVAQEFDALLPQMARPERTSGRQGFFHAVGIEGRVEQTTVRYIVRDHDAKLLDMKKEYAQRAAQELNKRYGCGTVVCSITDTYSNMCEMITPHMHLIDTAYAAVCDCGLEPVSDPVRGGTDGSRLSFMGLPCPNLGTGSENHHGKLEYACIQEMDATVDIILGIIKRYACR